MRLAGRRARLNGGSDVEAVFAATLMSAFGQKRTLERYIQHLFFNVVGSAFFNPIPWYNIVSNTFS